MQDNRKISEINKTRRKSKKDPEIMPLADQPQADKFRMTDSRLAAVSVSGLRRKENTSRFLVAAPACQQAGSDERLRWSGKHINIRNV